MTMIAIDGVDGAGKTGQIVRVKHALEADGHDVLVVHCPGRTGVPGIMRRLIMGQGCTGIDYEVEDGVGVYPKLAVESLDGDRLPGSSARVLFLAEWLYTYEKIIVPALDAGKTVLLDRSHFLSNVAYGSLPVMTEDQIYHVSHIRAMQFALTTPPDLAFVLDVPFEISQQRLGKRSGEGGEINHFDTTDADVFNARRDAYQTMAEEWDWVTLIDAIPDPDTVFETIVTVLKQEGYLYV